MKILNAIFVPNVRGWDLKCYGKETAETSMTQIIMKSVLNVKGQGRFMNKIILGISGKRGSGKTTLAKNLEQFGFVRLSLAGELKQKCKMEFGLTEDQVNGAFKESPTQYRRTDGSFFTPRDIMIRMGTFYRSIDKNFWLKQLDAQISLEDKIVIDDIRFTNEIDYLKDKYNAKFVRIEREEELNCFKAALDDLSENELDGFKEWDYLLIKECNRYPNDLMQFAEYINDTIMTHL